MKNERILKYYNLFLDDIRQPSDCLKYLTDERYSTEEWIIVRSHEEFVQLIQRKWTEREFVRLVSFDHDLNDEHYDPSMFKLDFFSADELLNGGNSLVNYSGYNHYGEKIKESKN